MYSFFGVGALAWIIIRVKSLCQDQSGSNTKTRLPRSNGHWSGEEGNSLWNSELEAVNKITGCQQFIYKGTIYFKNVDIIEIYEERRNKKIFCKR